MRYLSLTTKCYIHGRDFQANTVNVINISFYVYELIKKNKETLSSSNAQKGTDNI